MKKHYKPTKINPSLSFIAADISFLPATFPTLLAALSPEDTEVLAYLISWNRATKIKGKSHNSGCGDDDEVFYHSPVFDCNCFRCYVSFWARWDASPNHQLIHEIIEAYEEGLFTQKNNRISRRKKERGKKIRHGFKDAEGKASPAVGNELESVKSRINCSSGGGGGNYTLDDGSVELEKGSVRNLVNFIGEKIWGVWYRD